ncbi:MAG: hypothetical protein V4584_07395 [Verrucomicrobiota bacterium]
MNELERKPRRFESGLPTMRPEDRSGENNLSETSCPACFGIGSYLGKKWIQEDSGISMFMTVTIRKACEICRGSGSLQEPGHHRQLRVHRAASPAAKRRDRVAWDSYDRVCIYLLAAVLPGYIAFQLYRSLSAPDGWVKIAGALIASAILVHMLRNPAETTRFVRWCTLSFVMVAVCGGFALEFTPG